MHKNILEACPILAVLPGISDMKMQLSFLIIICTCFEMTNKINYNDVCNEILRLLLLYLINISTGIFLSYILQ